MSANDFIVGRLVEVLDVVSHWERHNFVDDFLVVHRSSCNFVVSQSQLVVVFDGVVVGSLGVNGVRGRHSKRVSDVVGNHGGLVMSHHGFVVSQKGLVVISLIKVVVEVLVRVWVVCASSVFSVIGGHIGLLDMSVEVMRRFVVVESVLGGVQSVRHCQLGYFCDFPRQGLLMSDGMFHDGVVNGVRLVAISVRIGVRLILGHLVRDGHFHVRLVSPLEVLHLGGVTVVRVDFVRTEVSVAVLVIMGRRILVGGIMIAIDVAVIVILFSFVVSVDGLIVVSIDCFGVVAVRVPVILIVGVVDWHVCGHVTRAENGGRVVRSIEVVWRIVGGFVVASPVVVTVSFNGVLQASHGVLALSCLHMAVDVSVVSRICISMVSISGISGMFESVDASVGVRVVLAVIFARVGVRICQMRLCVDMVILDVVLHGGQLVNGVVGFAVGESVVLRLLLKAGSVHNLVSVVVVVVQRLVVSILMGLHCVIGVFCVVGGVFAHSHGHPVVGLVVRGRVVRHIVRVVMRLVGRLVHVVVVVHTVSHCGVVFGHKSVMGTQSCMSGS